MKSLSDPGILIACITGIVALAGYLLARRGTVEANQQSAAATAIRAIEARSDRAEAGEKYQRERAEKAEAKLRERDDELDEAQDDARKLLVAQTVRCQAITNNLTETIVTLRDIVVSEVATAAAQSALDNLPPHPHDPQNEG